MSHRKFRLGSLKAKKEEIDNLLRLFVEDFSSLINFWGINQFFQEQVL